MDNYPYESQRDLVAAGPSRLQVWLALWAVLMVVAFASARWLPVFFIVL